MRVAIAIFAILLATSGCRREQPPAPKSAIPLSKPATMSVRNGLLCFVEEPNGDAGSIDVQSFGRPLKDHPLEVVMGCFADIFITYGAYAVVQKTRD